MGGEALSTLTGSARVAASESAMTEFQSHLANHARPQTIAPISTCSPRV